jgi:1,4-alpha-glucan branching enzyme
MTPGYLALILHAHLPFVHELEHEDSLEQHWLFEAITETYVPLLLVLDDLVTDGIDFRLTFSITPTLASMLADPLLQSRYLVWLERLMELAEKEVARTRSDPQFAPLARMYRTLFAKVHSAFIDRYKKDLLSAFHGFQTLGYVEILASAATHAYLPLLSVNETALRAQIKLGIAHYRRVFGQTPKGFWLPECGYFPGLDAFLDEEGIRFTILETHGITRADERPRYGVHAPIYCPSGVAAFGRDPDSSRQVWSATEGYPGDFDYREFYRDIGYDLDHDYVRPYILADGTCVNTGIKYHRITGKGDHKEPYVREWAERKAEIHAEHFLAERTKQIDRLGNLMDRSPLVVVPYDAELFGHWWFEGPRWLDHLIRKIAAQDAIRLVTLSEYLKEYPVNQTATPSMSSWGHKGFNEAWLNGRNDWIYPHLHGASTMMEGLAARYPAATGPALRALNQAARELLLAQASDWAFMISSGTMGDYASRRIKSHLENFHTLKGQVESAAVDEKWLETTENENNIFSENATFAAFCGKGMPSRTVLETSAIGAPQDGHGAAKLPAASPQPLHIVMVCPELVPFAKTGGLADMASALAPALEQLGHNVSLIMPAYRHAFHADVPLQETGIRVTALVNGTMQDAEVLTGRIGRAIRVYLIRADRYFDRAHLYGTPEGDYPDNVERFAFFSRAALELLGKISPPDVLHAHDWQAALAIVFLKTQPERYPGLAAVGTVLTVHNLGYQGLFSSDDWRFLDLDESFFSRDGLEFYGQINLLKAGLVFADVITTVSPTYAREIRTPDYGFGLEGVLQQRGKDVVGILNGADYAVWNPAADPFVAKNFSPEDLSGKQACKADLQRTFGLPQKPDVPLLAMVSRLAAQKGLDLVEAVLNQLLERDLQLVLLGAGDKRYQEFFQTATLQYLGRMGVRISFDEALAHKIEAGADIFLMPSRYEPSGLNQLYSMKYGTIPVVRATGGLKDSVEEFNSVRGNGTGFLFESYNGDAFLDAIDRALTAFRRKDDWTTLMKNAMARDYSWSRSASEYAALYRRLRFSYRDSR